MKAKLGNILNATLYFESLQNPNVDTPLKRLVAMTLSAGQSFRIVQIARSIEGHLKDFEDTRKKLIEKYGEEKDGQKAVPAENIGAFNDELIEVANAVVEIPGDKIRIETMSHAPMTAHDIYALSFLFAGLDEDTATTAKPSLSVVRPKRNGKAAVA